MIRCLLGLSLAAFHVASFAWTGTGVRGINANDALESRFWSTRPSDADLKQFRAAGFNAVRLPIRVTNHVDAADRIAPDYLTRVRDVVLAARALQIKVVVDL